MLEDYQHEGQIGQKLEFRLADDRLLRSFICICMSTYFLSYNITLIILFSFIFFFRNNNVRVTLFGEQAIEMSNFFLDVNQTKVVVLQLARITVFKGISISRLTIKFYHTINKYFLDST